MATGMPASAKALCLRNQGEGSVTAVPLITRDLLEAGSWIVVRLPLGGEILERLIGLVGQGDDEPHVEIAGLLIAPRRNALALETQDRARVGVGGHCQCDLAAQRRHGHLPPQNRFLERNREVELQVVALPREIGGRGYGHRQKDVSGRAAVDTLSALALQADLLPVLEARRDFHVEVATVG